VGTASGLSLGPSPQARPSLRASARRLLSDEGKGFHRQRTARLSLRPGNRLVRRWRGRTYVVEVTDHGLVYDGERFNSLSVIASNITGTRWSGPKFFGLVS